MTIFNLVLSVVFVLVSTNPPVLGEHKTLQSEETKIIKIQMDGFPKSLKLIIPKEFSLPKTKEQKVEAKDYLVTLGQNEARKGKYSQVLMTDWKDWPGETILVYSLGSLQNNQGKISNSDWKKIKASFEKMSLAQANETGKNYADELEENTKLAKPTDQQNSSQEIEINSNSIIAFGKTTKSYGGADVNLLTAMKMIYHNGYVVSTLLMIDQEILDSQQSIRQYANLIDFKI